MKEQEQNEQLSEEIKDRRRTTPEKKGVFQSIFNQFYYLGANTEIYVGRFRRAAEKRLAVLWKSVKVPFLFISRKVTEEFQQSTADVKEVVTLANVRYQRNKELVTERGGKKSDVILYGVQEYTRMSGNLFGKVMNYVAPVLSIIFLIFTIQFYTRLNYSMEVIVNGESLGYIKDETVYQEAEKLMQSRIEYMDGSRAVYTTPTFRLLPVNERLLISPEKLSDKIVEQIGSKIKEAYGLYVSGEFLGAVESTQKDLVVNDINALIEARRTPGTEGEKVMFKEDVRLVKGIYLVESIVNPYELSEKVTGNSMQQETYTVANKDTLSGIAAKLEIPSAEILAMNPEVTANTIRPGQELIIQRSRPFLSVIMKGIISYEDTLAYETEKTEDPKSSQGQTVVTRKGKEGKALFKAEVTMEDGIEIDRNVLERTVITEPVNERVKMGTKPIISKTNSILPNEAIVNPAVALSTGFVWPVQSTGRVTCAYLCYRGHTAVDIQSFAGDYTLAAASGVVTYAGYRGSYGNCVIIDHGNGVQTLYAHHSSLLVSTGQYVTQSTPIATQGRSGNATGVHLHFEIIINGRRQNPATFLGY